MTLASPGNRRVKLRFAAVVCALLPRGTRSHPPWHAQSYSSLISGLPPAGDQFFNSEEMRFEGLATFINYLQALITPRLLEVWAANAVEGGSQASSPLWCTQRGIGKKCQSQNWKFLSSIWCCFPSMYFLASRYLIYSFLFSIFWCISPLSPLQKASLSAFLPLNILPHAIGKILLFSYFSGNFPTRDREIIRNCWKQVQ